MAMENDSILGSFDRNFLFENIDENVLSEYFSDSEQKSLDNITEHDFKQEYLCNICNEVMEEFLLELHFCTFHSSLIDEQLYKNVQNMKCKLCEEDFENSENLRNHIIALHLKDGVVQIRKIDNFLKSSQCQICQRLFSTTQNLECHQSFNVMNDLKNRV